MCSTNNALLIDELNIFKAINLSYLRILELNIKHQNSSGIHESVPGYNPI